jgi:hypothetical protein
MPRTVVWILACLLLAGSACAGGGSDLTPTPLPRLECNLPPHARIDAHTPESRVADWGAPLPLSPPLNSPCPEDAIEISRDGNTLYVLFTQDLIGNLTPEQVIAPPTGTYRLTRSGGPAEFSAPLFFDLGQGVDGSLDGELSFSPDGTKVYFHSLRSSNTGYRQDPAVEDFLDIYVAELVAGVPGPGRSLGAPVNSIYPDGEHALHPDGVTLYFSSLRVGGLGGSDIWTSRWDGSAWSEPVNLGAPLNSDGADLQPAFTADGHTMYFVSDRDPAVGMAIYRAAWRGDGWGEPELVIRGIVGEPSLTGDGLLLYFVHVLTDGEGIFDADIWYTQRVP